MVWQAPAYLKLGGLGLLGMGAYFMLAHLFSVSGYLMLRELLTERLRKK
jgi:hypothetical protein